MEKLQDIVLEHFNKFIEQGMSGGLLITIDLIRRVCEQRLDKTCLRDFRPGSAQTGKMARGLKFRMRMDCIIFLVKTKVLISCMVTAYAKSMFSHDTALMILIWGYMSIEFFVE